MAHLIDKSAVVAEIERLKAELGNTFSDKWACGSLDNILSFLDTLEVREVDLEKALPGLEEAAKEYSIIDGIDDIEEYARYDIEKYNSFKDGAKWQKAQKEK